MKKKILGLLAISGIAMFALCILIGSNEPAFKLIRAVDNPYSITFNRSNGTTTQGNGKTITSSTSAGGKTIYLVNDNDGWFYNNANISNYVAYLDKGNYVYFTEDSAGNNHFCFQGVTSISLTLNTSYSREIKVETSIDTENWTSTSHYFSSSSKTYEFSTPARYIRLKWDLDYSHYLKEITINYECNNSFVEVPQSLELTNVVTNYSLNDKFTEPTAKVVYASGVKRTVYDVVYTGYNLSVGGDYTVTATYIEGGIAVTATYQITVSANSESLSGTYKYGSRSSFVFNSDGTGVEYYSFGSNYSMHFNYSLQNGNISITPNIQSGDGTYSNFGTYRLAYGSNVGVSGTYNKTANTVTLNLYNSSGTINAYEYAFSE